ncbi:MAG: hypothetical protein ACXV3D_02245 [Halobacteriota archaeon]
MSYSISDGIPNLYVSNERAIEDSSEHRFPQFIVTQEKLNACDHLQTREGEAHSQIANRALAAFFVSLGWVLLSWTASKSYVRRVFGATITGEPKPSLGSDVGALRVGSK